MDNTLNQKAIELLGEQDYPKSKEEALQLKALLAKALEAAEDPNDPVFKEKYDELNEIVNWSLTRHKTWKWPVIAGAALFAALLFWGYTAQLKEVKGIKAELKQVKSWEAVKDTVITWEECGTEYSGTDYYKDATTWKTNRLALLKSTYERYS